MNKFAITITLGVLVFILLPITYWTYFSKREYLTKSEYSNILHKMKFNENNQLPNDYHDFENFKF